MSHSTVPLALIAILDQARRLLWIHGVEAGDGPLKAAHDSLPAGGRTYHAVARRYLEQLLARMEGRPGV